MAGGPSLAQQALRAYFYVVLWMTVRCGNHASVGGPRALAVSHVFSVLCVLHSRPLHACSMAVILFNKWLLAYSGFPYPLALTMCVPQGRLVGA